MKIFQSLTKRSTQDPQTLGCFSTENKENIKKFPSQWLHTMCTESEGLRLSQQRHRAFGTWCPGEQRPLWSPMRTSQDRSTRSMEHPSQRCSQIRHFSLTKPFKVEQHTHSRRQMQVWGGGWHFLTEKYISLLVKQTDRAAPLCLSLLLLQNSEESQSSYRGWQEKNFYCFCLASLTVAVPRRLSRARMQAQPAVQHTRKQDAHSDFQTCQLPAAWPQASHFRFPNTMASWKKEFFLTEKNIYRHKKNSSQAQVW